MASKRLVSLCRRIHTLQAPIINHSSLNSRQICLSAAVLKVRKGDKKKEANANIVHAQHMNNQYVADSIKEMEALEARLDEELAAHFSSKVDLRVFEEIVVTLENGEDHKMNRLGRVTMKNPQMVMINFGDNPTAIKAAKVALQKSSLGVNPQHEGIVLYISVPRMTRERREEMAQSAKTTIFNDFKDALNKIFIKFDKKATREIKCQDEFQGTHNLLLSTKRSFEQRALEKIAAQQKELMKEIA